MESLKSALGKIVRAPKPLFFETNGKEGVWHLSLGRLAFWIVFIAALYMWLVKEAPLPNNMYEFLVLIVGYNFSKKLTGPVGELLKSKAKQMMPVAPPPDVPPEADNQAGEP